MTESSPNSPVSQIRWVDKVAIADVVGDIDLERSRVFQQQLLAVLDENPERVLVNLAKVPYMDSSGVASLVKLLSRARKSNLAINLVAMNERVRSIFEITRLDSIFTIYDTEEEALA